MKTAPRGIISARRDADHPSVSRVRHDQDQVLRFWKGAMQFRRSVQHIEVQCSGPPVVEALHTNDAHTERSQSRHFAPDPPDADDDQCLSLEVSARIAPVLVALVRSTRRSFLWKAIITIRQNSASGFACTPLAVVKTVSGIDSA
jgi:hypothetical protein